MPYKDKNRMKQYLEGYYAKNKLSLNKKRTETRKKSQTLDSVSNPVSNPTVVSQTPADIARKKLIEDLKAKISAVPAVIGKPAPQSVPMKPAYVRPAYAPKIKSENYSESTHYDYSMV